MRSALHLPLLLACAATAIAAPVRAQSVDYAGLEDTIGEPVTTSVTGKPQRASDAPASIVIITRDEIARSPARDVPGLLQSYAGIDVNRWTAGQSDVAVRGGVQTYNARLLVLVDGRQVYLDHYGMTDWNLLGIQLEEIQQIELVRGPASALFGFNAAAGVVNIITVDPSNRKLATASGDVGTHGEQRVSGALALPLSDMVGIKLSAGHQREDERAIPAGLYRPLSIGDTQSDQASGGVTVTPGTATRLVLSGGYASNQQLEFLPSQVLTEQRYHSENIGLVVDHDTDWGSLNARAYTNWQDSRYGVTPAGVGQPAFAAINSNEFRNRIIVTQGSALIRLGLSDTLRIGGEYRNNELTSASLFSQRIAYNVAAGDAMLDLHPSDRVGLTGAIRLDHLWLGQDGAPVSPAVDAAASYRRAFDSVSFNAALLVQVGADGQLRLNGGRGVQSPSLIDYGFRVQLPIATAPLPVFIAGSPTIKPVTVWNAEIGYTQRAGKIATLTAGGFYTRTDNAIGSPGDAPEYQILTQPELLVVSRFANIGHFQTYGIELSAFGKIGPIHWRANYTWTHDDDDLPPVEPSVVYSLSPSSTTPRHVANLDVGYDAGAWFATVDLRFTSSAREFAFDTAGSLALYRVNDAVGVDAKLGYRLGGHLTVQLAGENLTAAGGAAGSPIPADRRIRAGMSIAL
jgi:iron complex outermembrane receptor protein